MKVLAVALLTFVMLMAWHEAVVTGCETDADCPQFYVCRTGFCVPFRSQLENGDTHVATTGNETLTTS